MRSVSGKARFVRSYPLASFGHVQNFELTPPDKDFRWMNVSCAVCPVLARQASCKYPSMSVGPELWNGQPQDMLRAGKLQGCVCKMLILLILELQTSSLYHLSDAAILIYSSLRPGW